jgi:hypothetical protein
VAAPYSDEGVGGGYVDLAEVWSISPLTWSGWLRRSHIRLHCAPQTEPL